jgi:zinc protease
MPMSAADSAWGPTVLPRPAVGTPPLPRVPVPVRTVLDNRLGLVAAPTGRLPQVILRFVLPGGTMHEPASHPGTAHLVGRLLTEGTERWSADELNRQLDRLGASLDVHVGHDFVEVELVLLSETMEDGLALLAEVVARPVFPEAEVERVRRETLDGLRGRLDEPGNVADDHAALAVFGSAHPYGRPTIGSEAGIREVEVDRLRAFHAAAYRPHGGVLVAAGALDPERLGDAVSRAFDGWTGRPDTAIAATPARVTHAAGQRIDLPWQDAQQAEIRVAGTGMERTAADWIPGAVANFLLGGSTITGRLGANLREDKGWTYGVRSSFSAGLHPGGWLVDTAVDVDVREAALAEILTELRLMVREPVSAAELRRAQDALVLSLPRAFETPGRVVNRLMTLTVFGLDEEYWERFPAAVRAVTSEDVQRIAARYFDPDRLVSVVVG